MKRPILSATGDKAKGNRKRARLYEVDETAWLEQMADLIDQQRYDELDYANLREFLRSMAMRDRREVLRRLARLLMHLLKWDHQPRKRTRSWRVTILHQRHELQDILESRTLRNHAEKVLAKAYARAIREAAAETGLAEDLFPSSCPYSVADLLSDN